EWDEQFWIRFKAAFLATKKQQMATNNAGCGYLNDDEAIVKNPNISAMQGEVKAMSYHTPKVYQTNCRNNAGYLVDRLSRECRAVSEKIKIDSLYRHVLIDTFANYCIRNAGVYNPYGFITRDDIDSGKLDNIIASIHLNVTGSD